MPFKSHFAFASAPTDLTRWREAQNLAASGAPVLSRLVRAALPHPDDFLDGDPFGENYDRMMDIYMNYDSMFGPLTSNKRAKAVTVPQELKGLGQGFRRTTYGNSYAHRAPLVQLGTYKYTGKKWVKRDGDNLRVIQLSAFLNEFEEVESNIVQPAIYFAALNKDWGYLSESVPGRVPAPQVPSGQSHSSNLDILPGMCA